jgi:Flp pilus assembly pilin Flp
MFRSKLLLNQAAFQVDGFNHTMSASPPKYVQRNQRDQRGQGMTEYIIIVALIAVAAIGVYRFFGQTIRHQTAGLAQEVSGTDASTQITSAGTSATSAVTQGATNKSLSSYNGN